MSREHKTEGSARPSEVNATDIGPAVGALTDLPVVRKRAARIAIGGVFFVNGAAFATWAARVPAVRDSLGLSPGALSVALTGLAAGAFVGLPLAGGLVARWGSRRVLVGAALYLAALPLITLAPRLLHLTAALLVFAIGNSILDVAMNTQGALAERACGRPIMGGLHAMFSLGGVLGAATGGLAVNAGVGVGTHFLATAVALSIACACAAAFLLPDVRRDRASGPLITLPTRRVWAPGLIAFCALMGEGLMNDWGALYLNDVAGTSAWTAALGFSVFSGGMVTGRLAADHIRARTGHDRVLRGCVLVAAGGAGLAIALPAPWTGLLAYALIGLGLSAVIPMTFSHTAERSPQQPATAIAAVSTVGYVGFLVGPPIMGALAEWAGLHTAMLVFPFLMCVLFVLAPSLRR
ncbi:MFS transporter [Actinomadura vinacea]|uniref:MFS transporter n=1 Tax=Actinomadura vinacea TaxID=115336 RepID=A0ABN3IQ06_9ACTN